MEWKSEGEVRLPAAQQITNGELRLEAHRFKSWDICREKNGEGSMQTHRCTLSDLAALQGQAEESCTFTARAAFVNTLTLDDCDHVMLKS